jgi:lipopolysaccharide transport protein LptA
MIRFLCWAMLAACAWSGSVRAAEAVPTNITADTMMVQQAKQTAVFTGHAVLLRKDFQLHADRLVVHYDPKNNAELRAAEAYGHVRIHHGQMRGTSDEARYSQKKANIILIGHAVLQEPGRTVHGERIVHDLRKRSTEVQQQPGGQVHLHLDGEAKPSPAPKEKP